MNPNFLLSVENVLSVASRGARNAVKEKHPLDMTASMTQPFDFGLTRPTIMKMEKQRQLLHYLRLEQIQFKDLVAFRKPFTPPTSKQVIQVRHQHYQGEDHPAARKVVLTVPVASLPLKNAAAVHKLQLLAGARWEPPLPEALRAKSFKGKERSLQPEGQEDRGTLKIACELFPASRMNEKWCSDTLDKLLSEANNAKDTFADVPLDLRNARAKLLKSRKLRKNISLAQFPQEWLAAAQAAPTPTAGKA
ncbi:hypothetical protein BMF94_2566 [Rhodotorula taiwanensis]|uniref:Small ribosomal subunit protein mS35 mitochondrial conserved domain-containing protein n=1 Tax=Rhodotorula taiwanensis TaxID=741276 RepID=A0A2S5BC86_9BASI|nr:hypothetical protein BMF94_2566 [Rhodotorula taiwanensis]